MVPEPRVRLCQDEFPARAAGLFEKMRFNAWNRSRNSSSPTSSMPAAAKQASASS